MEVGPAASRRTMATLGAAVAFMSVCSMLIGRSIPSPWWLSAPANALVIFVGLYALRHTETRGRRPAIVGTGVLSIAACALVLLTLGTGTVAILLAGAAILAVWLIGANLTGRGLWDRYRERRP